MRKGILIALGLVAAVGLLYIVTRGGPEPAPSPDPVAAAPPAPPAPQAESAGNPAAPPAAATGSRPSNPTASDPAATAAAAAPPQPRDPRVSNIDGKVYMNDPITVTRAMHSDSSSPMDDVSAVGTALHYFQLVYKENPFGSLNAEIVDQLTGNNPKKIVVIPPDHPAINAKGELVDRYGTPYFFHGLTRNAMDVWSAGPDLKFGSADDVKLGIDEEFGEQLGLAIDP